MILVLGCSYADPNMNPSEETWPTLLNKNFDVCNEARSGTGPQENLHILKTYVDKGIDKNKDILIFFVPEYYRMNFKYLEKKDQVFSYASDIRGNLDPKDYFNKKFVEKYGADKLDWQSQWWEYYQVYDNNDQLDIIKIYATIAYFTKYFFRSLIIPTDQNSKNLKKWNIDIQSIIEHTSVAYTPDIVLDTISKNEKDNVLEYGEDTRPNHLSLYNHVVMYKLLSEWINLGIVPTNQFHTKKPRKHYN